MVDAVFLGDSWLDDRWNEHKTWGTILAESEGWSYLNLSKAGCTTEYIMSAIKTHPGLKNTYVSTQWIIHIGGNDLLYWVIKNPSRITYDIWKREKHFFKYKGEEIASRIACIVEYIITHYGATKITISSNTACYGVPLCRAFGLFYAPFTTRQHMDMITAEVNLALLRVVKYLMYEHSQVRFSFYNECKTCIEEWGISWKWDLFHPQAKGHSILAESFKQSIQVPLQHHIFYFTQLKESIHNMGYSYFLFLLFYVLLSIILFPEFTVILHEVQSVYD